MTVQDAEQLREAVKAYYGRAATAASAAAGRAGGDAADPGTPDPGAAGGGPATARTPDASPTSTSGPADASCCGPSCCGGHAQAGSAPVDVAQPASPGLPLYDAAQTAGLPAAAVAASLGCGNPTALADLRPGQVVLDLGSGGGIDVLLSARHVAPGGTAYGVDMTEQMHALALRNKAEAGVDNAEFLLGTIEDVPLPDASVDVVISNCVVNLSGDKPAVLREAFRVLRPGGRLAVSDIVLTRPLPAPLADLVGLWTGCVAGAMVREDLAAQLAAAGFADVSIEPVHVLGRDDLLAAAGSLDPGAVPAGLGVAAAVAGLDGVVTSASIRATKPLSS